MTSLISQLAAHITANLAALRIRGEQWAVDIDGGRIEPGGQNVTVEGYHAADYHYTAVLTFERLPEGSVQLLLLLVITWLTENDQRRTQYNLPWPLVDVENEGDHTAQVTIEVEFVDRFYLGADPTGPIVIGGVHYRVDAFELFAAEGGTVQGAPL